MTICPYCSQDVIWNVQLSSDPRIAFKMCFECDSVWRPGELTSDAEGTNFESYMREIGREPAWDDVEKISHAE